MTVAPGLPVSDRTPAFVGFIACLLAALPALGGEIDLPPDLTTLGAEDATEVRQALATEIGDPGILGTANAVPMAADGVYMDGAPMTVSSGGSYFNPTLGSHIRARYNTRSYGQAEGNFSLGTMSLWETSEGFGFFDGQVTANDESRVGYNLGLGYRWLTLPLLPNSIDGAKIAGVSVWADGQSVDGESFFPQVGVSLEYLGDRFDIRANGYIPVGPESRDRDFAGVGDTLEFTQNFIANSTVGVRDTRLTVGEIELAGRIADLDAWVFGSVYAFDGGPYDEVGGKIGLRGYATHDLLLSIAIANDDLFDTNAVFSATWFIGRTRANNCPSGTLEDRFREPVLRNDYVAIRSDPIEGVGAALTDADGDVIRVVHVDSTAAAGGDGTIENPLSSLDEIKANSQAEDIVLVTAGSVFDTPAQMAMLQDNQIFLGEGGDNTFSVTTDEFGAIDLPETSPGAGSGAIPIIRDSTGTAVMLADDNTVQNFEFNSNATAIGVDTTNGSINPTLRLLTINDSTDAAGAAVNLQAVSIVDVDDLDGDDDDTETFNALGNVVIDQVDFARSVGNDILINGTPTGAVDETRAETISITEVTSTDLAGAATNRSIVIRETSDVIGAATTIDEYTFDGSATSGGALSFVETGRPVVVTNSDIQDGVGPAVEAIENTGTVLVGTSNTISGITGEAVVIEENEGAVDVDADITVAGTGPVAGEAAIRVVRNEAAVGFDGEITASDANSILIDDSRAQVSFGGASQAGSITHSGAGDTITITDAGTNTGNSAAVSFTGDITSSGSGRVAVITGGDDDVNFLGDVTTDNDDDTTTPDDGDSTGILVQQRASGADILFSGNTNLNTGSDTAVSLVSNDDDSVVTFNGTTGSLEITTTTGNGIVGSGAPDMGELNVTGTGNTITTAGGRPLVLADGSSTSGVTFDEITTTSATTGSAVDLNAFDGTVTVNDGVLRSDVATVSVQDSSINFDEVDFVSGTNVAVNATLDDDTNRTIEVTNANLGLGAAPDADVLVESGGSATNSVTLADLEGVRNLTFTTQAAATGVLDIDVDDTTMTGNFSATDAGAGSSDITASLTNVNGTSTDITVTTNDGDANVTLDNVETGGALAVTSTADGAANLTATNSGNDTGDAFTSIVVAESGNGGGTASFFNTEATSGIGFTSGGAGTALLLVNGGSYGGDISGAKTGTGDFNASVVNGVTITDGRVILDGDTTGQVDYEVSGLTYTATTVALAEGAIDLSLGATVTSADVTVSNNSVIVSGAGGLGHVFALDTGGGTVDFALTGNNFTNQSSNNTATGGGQTAFVNQSGTGTLNFTGSTNTFTNSGTADGFAYAKTAGSTGLVNFVTNGPSGTNLRFQQGTGLTVRGVDEMGVDDDNPGDVIFDTPPAFDDSLSVPTP